jgi:CRISPR-associated protein Cpf1
MRTLKDFHNQYSVQKTLRFKLEPIGKTEEFIERNQVLETDERRAAEYLKVKEYIDRYHRQFIEDALSKPLLKVESQGKQDSLEDFADCYNNDNGDKRSENLENIQEKLRAQIAKGFSQLPAFARIKKKELIKEDLPQFLKDKSEIEIVSHFDEFTTYFTGFHQNRMNMYTADAKSTSIAFRLINQNLVKFVDNSNILEKVVPALGNDIIAKLDKDFEPFLNVHSALDMFKIENYNEVLTQLQIELYNAIIGGRVDEGNKVEIKGLNQYINEFNQTHEKSLRIPKLKPLFKQILSENVGVSFRMEQFTDASQVQTAIKEEYIKLESSVFDKLKEMIKSLPTFNLNGIYLANDLGLTDICQRHYGAWDKLNNALVAEFDALVPRKKTQSHEKRDDQVKKYLKSIKSISLGKIDSLLADVTEKSIVDYFTNLGAIDNETTQRENLLALIPNRYNAIKEVLDCPTPSDELLRKNIEGIKDLLDAIKDLQRFIKPLCGCGEELDKDEMFYSDFSPLYETLDDIITPLYNKVRSYLTKKPYKLDKFKLNFDNSQLLDGWDVNKENDYLSILLRKDGYYYLAIANKNDKRAITEINQAQSDGSVDCYEKLNYKLIPSPFRMLPKVFFSRKGLETFNPSQEILDIYRNKKFQLGDSFDKRALSKLIDFYKTSIPNYESWQFFDFDFLPTNSYNSINEFYSDIEQQGYKIDFKQVPVSLINKLNEDGLLYVFKLANKDFSPYSKGRPNLHTIYWKMLFDDNNLKDVIYKLNGKAEMFFRRSSIPNPVIHPANKEIANKSAYNKQHKAASKFDYDIIKDRRFTRNQYEFHVPITMNFKSAGSGHFNQDVLSFIKEKGIRHIIGIDRGERHLLYLTMINLKGEIVEQFSLNSVASNPNNPDYKQDYNELLSIKEGDRLSARRNWSTIENIKELKAGYLSQIVHLLSKMMIENDAILVLENLNTGFMRGRQKVEKSVYLKFEKMLIDKLNYVVDKTVATNEPSGALKALQLTDTYDNFNKYQKGNVRQCGFVFYIPAWNTSKTDPVTGFVNLFDTRLSTIGEIKSFFSKFDRIKYSPKNDAFEFTFDYNKFTTRAEGTRSCWTISSQGERIFTHRSKEQNNQFVSDTVHPTQLFKEVFKMAGSDINGNLKEEIASINSLETLKQLLHAFKLVMQMRNSVTGTEVDFLLSPAIDAKGTCFDSRKGIKTLPENADANGAYNIARKGLMIVEQIQNADDIANIKFAVSNKDWLKFAQG